MGVSSLFLKVEDRPTPSCVYNWRVYVCAAVAGSAAIMIGYDSAFIGTTLALPSFKKEFDFGALSTSEVNLLNANIVSCYQAGAFFGAIFAYLAAYFLGRTKGLAVFSAIFVLGSGMMLGANGQRGLGLIYGGRVLAGLGVGGASNLARKHTLGVFLCVSGYILNSGVLLIKITHETTPAPIISKPGNTDSKIFLSNLYLRNISTSYSRKARVYV